MCKLGFKHGSVLKIQSQGDLSANLLCVACDEPVAYWEQTPEERNQLDRKDVEGWV